MKWNNARIGETNAVSVYLDCFDQLGYVGKPYWEAYPIRDENVRFLKNEVSELMAAIVEELNTSGGGSVFTDPKED